MKKYKDCIRTDGMCSMCALVSREHDARDVL